MKMGKLTLDEMRERIVGRTVIVVDRWERYRTFTAADVKKDGGIICLYSKDENGAIKGEFLPSEKDLSRLVTTGRVELVHDDIPTGIYLAIRDFKK